jgi:hypothetical protein
MILLILTLITCGRSFAQSNCLTDEEIKKVRLIIIENQQLDSTLSIARWRSNQLKKVIDSQDELIVSYQEQIMLKEQKERMLIKQVDYAKREAVRQTRRKKLFQVGTGVSAAAIGALLILK